jgi:NAD-dependent DNA ligase
LEKLRGVGKEEAKEITQHFSNLDQLAQKDESQRQLVEAVGEITAQNIM